MPPSLFPDVSSIASPKTDEEWFEHYILVFCKIRSIGSALALSVVALPGFIASAKPQSTMLLQLLGQSLPRSLLTLRYSVYVL